MSKTVKFLVLFSFIFAFASVSVKAWDDAGHKTIAYIAWNQMSKDARERAYKILMSAPEDADLSVFYLQDSRSADVKKRELFMIAATWADIVRNSKFKVRAEKYHHSNWHYDDTFWTTENGQVKILPNPNEDGGQGIKKLIEFDKALKDAAVSDEEKAVALAWILHIGGDIHQPLHTSARITELEPKGDQGGNTFSLSPKDAPREGSENLHWFWDSILGRVIARNDKADDEYIPMLADMIMKKYPPTEMQNQLAIGNFGEWQKGSFKLATTEVFSPDLIRYETPSPKYRRNAFAVSEEQMALAGYRLGAMLNQILEKQAANLGNLSRGYFDGNINFYQRDAAEKKAKIGNGENDLWLWVKTWTTSIKDDELRDSTINIDVENSVVTLKGILVREIQRQAAVQAAKQIDGVKAVKDFLKVSK